MGKELGHQRKKALAFLLGALGYIKYKTYISELPERNTWGFCYSNNSAIQGQPFAWASYLCLGDVQIASAENKLSIRYYFNNAWEGWVSII